MAVIWRERRADGTEEVTRWDYDPVTGVETTTQLSGPPPSKKQRHVSMSNGIVGGRAVLEKAKAMDAKLGVADKIRYIPRGGGRYDAEFKTISERRAWLKAHKRVDFDAGYRDPCPGDFSRNCPPEFE